jgi:hypothetical protein
MAVHLFSLDMADNKKSFILYCDQRGIFNKLSDEQAGVLIKHIFAYVSDENPTAEFITELAFESIKQQLKRDLKSWETQQEQRKQAGLKSAEIRKRNATSVDERSISSTDNVTVTVNVNDTVNGNETDSKEVAIALAHPLIKFIQENAPTVNSMKQPLTNEQAEKLLIDLQINNKERKDELKRLIMSMENYVPLKSKSKSANLTIRKWWATEQKGANGSKPIKPETEADRAAHEFMETVKAYNTHKTLYGEESANEKFNMNNGNVQSSIDNKRIA